jgi:alkylated DNA nucleotide flippase Atl1
MTLQRVEALFIKRGAQREPRDTVTCVAGLGIEGDAHANRLSPRQILVTLASELDVLHIPPGSLFENMVISSPAPESFRPGAALTTASGVEIRLTMYCEPCKRIAPVVGDLRKMIHRRGILGTIVTGGQITCGERIELVPGPYPPLPDSAKQKFADFVRTIPAGRVVRYLDVTVAMGVAPSAVRAIPGFIARAAGTGLPTHRIVNARGALSASMPDQAAKLAAEGVTVQDGTIDLDDHLWAG